MTLLVEFAGGVGFKPRAGNDYWFHHDDCRRALDGCHIYGKDARRLAEASPGQLHPLDVNRTVGVPEAVHDRLPLSDAVAVESVEELNAAIRQHYLPALDALGRTVDRTQRAIVESYAEVARPAPGLEPAAVAVVDPTRARLYKGSRYVKSCSIASGGTTPPEGQLEQRVPDVVELIDPVMTVELPPLVKEERTDPAAVADAYEPAYEQLFDAAGWE